MADEMELDGCPEGDSDLPEGWALATVGDILTINYGKGLIEAKRRGGHVAVYGSAGIVGYHDEPLTGGPTIVIGRKGTVGAVSYSVSPCWPIDTAYFVEEFFGLDPEYLFHALGSLGLGELDTSTAVPGLNRDDAYRQQLPVPPLAEQKRIVAKVEELLVQVNAARDRLAKVPAMLKRFRQSVLAAACSGRLTADWRENHPDIEPASELLKRILAERASEIRTRKGSAGNGLRDGDDQLEDLPEGWCSKEFGQITRNHDGRRIPLKVDDRAKRRGQYPYYGASGIIDTIDEYLFDGEHLLVSEDGANLLARSTPIAFRASGQFWVNNHAHVVQTYGGIPLQYLEVFINGLDIQHYVTGSAQPKLTQAAMNSIVVPIPPLSEQEEIVRRVEALFALADDGIEKSLRAATIRTEKLTQAILAKAFRGELVPTEAELALKEGRTYEPASALLARIRQERAEQEASKAMRRTRTGKALPS